MTAQEKTAADQLYWLASDPARIRAWWRLCMLGKVLAKQPSSLETLNHLIKTTVENGPSKNL